MHYYTRNLGDYAKKAGRLSMLQHGAYTLLLDSCYDREQFPTRDEAIEWTWASTTEEVEAVDFVLRKFFTLENGVYVQKRVQQEIEEYREKAETNRRIALEREAKKKLSQTSRDEKSTNRARTVQERAQDEQNREPNQEPITNNQEPITNINTSLVLQANPTPKAKRGTRLPKDWKPSLEFWDEAKLINPNISDARLTQIAAEFRDYWISKSGAGATKNDWLATWRNWIRKERTLHSGAPPPHSQFLTAREKNAQRNAEIFDINRARDF